jgi:predicted transcriptional regulator
MHRDLQRYFRGEITTLTSQGWNMSKIADYLGISREYVRYVLSSREPTLNENDELDLPPAREKHRGYRGALSEDDTKKIAELRNVGHTLKAIAKAFGVTPRAVSYQLSKPTPTRGLVK